LDISKYEMLVFFSPTGVKALFNNFPEFKQNNVKIATFGTSTAQIAKDHGLEIQIEAPTKKAPSMSKAIEEFVSEQRKRKR